MGGYLFFGLGLAAFASPVIAWCRLDSALRREEREQRREPPRRVKHW